MSGTDTWSYAMSGIDEKRSYEMSGMCYMADLGFATPGCCRRVDAADHLDQHHGACLLSAHAMSCTDMR